MRAGGCSLQQSLTAEAASVVKQAVTLARRRGHAQVTPLHVANTMLASSTGLLRTACLQSHSHPLQCKALELCFNVALNRLPASNSSPMLGNHGLHHHHHSQHPSISNALIAAFKRAQAHQRRGSIENQQQPLLAVKIELEQLIISILDDPSVSRVMREAGFSSTQVKSNVEQAVSLEIRSQSSTTPNSVSNNNISSTKSKETNLNLVLSNQQSPMNGSKAGKPAAVSSDPVRNEDVMSVMESLVSKKRRSVVIVGECTSNIEGVVRGVMDKVEKEKLDVPEGLRGVKFIPLNLGSSFMNSSRVEVEQKFVELKNLLRSCMTKGVILYLGDLKWTSEYRASNSSGDPYARGYYCPVEHMIMEIGKLVCGIGENINHNNGRFWLMGIATFQTYMRCKSGQPSLETIWGIHPLTIPAGSLRFSLLPPDSDLKSDHDQSTTKNNGTSKSLIVETGNGDDQLNCCAECTAQFEAESRTLRNSSTFNSESTTSSNLPAWLRQCKADARGFKSNNEVLNDYDRHDHNCVPVAELCRKWNSFCYSTHQHQQINNKYSSEKTLITFSSVSPSSSASGFSYDHHHRHQQNPNQAWRDHGFWLSAESSTPNKSTISTIIEPSLRMYFAENKENCSSKQPMLFSSNPNSTPTSASSSDVMEAEYSHKFKELNSENLKTLCNALEKKVPWQKDIIPEIARTILKCRSGMVRRKGGKLGLSMTASSTHDHSHVKEETWLLFQGVDTEAKEKIAKELAKLVFGSSNDFVSIALSTFSSTRADSTEDYNGRNNNNNVNKRSRDEQSGTYIERFGEAVSMNPHRVFLVEDVEQADYFSQMGFKRAIERGRVMNSSGEHVELRDAIVILSCESFSSRSRACSPQTKQKIVQSDHDHQDQAVEETSPCVSLDLNISFEDHDMDENASSAHEDDDDDDDQSIDDIGLLESVDRRIIFKIQEL